MNQKLINWLKLVLKFSFSFSILAYMVYSGRLELDVVKKGFFHGYTLVFTLALVLLSTFSALLRWGLLLKGQGLYFPFPSILRYGMIGAFFNTTMPGAVSGDLIKAWYVMADNKTQKKTPVLTSIVLDRILGVFGLVLVAVTPVLIFWSDVWRIEKLHQVILLLLLLFVGVILFFSYMVLCIWGPFAKVRKKLERFEKNKVGKVFLQAYDAWLSYRQTPEVVFFSLALSCLNHVCAITAIWLCARALGDYTLSAYQFYVLAPLAMLTTAVPVAPAGLGVGHVAFAALFGMVGSTHGAEIFTMYVTVTIFVNLTGIFFYLRSPKPNLQSTDVEGLSTSR